MVAKAASTTVRRRKGREGFKIEDVEEGETIVWSGQKEARRYKLVRQRRDGFLGKAAPTGADLTEVVAIDGAEERKDLF